MDWCNSEIYKYANILSTSVSGKRREIVAFWRVAADLAARKNKNQDADIMCYKT